MSTRHEVTSAPQRQNDDPRLSILGVEILNITKLRAVELLEKVIRSRQDQAQSVFFVNAHTLNLASGKPEYRSILNSGNFVFGDGVGVRWAGKLQGVRVADNLVGTDFTPFLLRSTANKGYSYFMLGSDESTIERAAEYARKEFPGWKLCGLHHGYINTPERLAAVIEQINASEADVLLVGMGNPLQEQWIHEHQSSLRVSLCLGIGGLFDYWAGNVSRAPQWLRALGHEWIWRLYQQPAEKARRYIIGNPLFLARILCERLRRR
ncbi:MAG: WecB/TagA/CpsF family glycosyltransferase [Thermoguttaceae bacterium]